MRAPTPATPARRARARGLVRRGLTAVEAMMSLVISAMLLTAIGVAFSASAGAVSANGDFFAAAQASRVTMDRLMNEVRRCTAVQVLGDRINLLAYDGKDRTYRFDSASGQILLVTNDDLTDADYVLARGVAQCTFTHDLEPDPSTQVNRVVRVAVSIAVVVGKNQVVLTGSAVPRRSMVYQ